MKNFICVTCGTQFAATTSEPDRCPICEDERQYVNPVGQQWTTLDGLTRTHRNAFQKKEPYLYSVITSPKMAIGQRALLVQTTDGTVLWDCLSVLDDATVDISNSMGGLDAITISHPHYYCRMAEWSRAVGDIPVYLHQADRRWVMRPDDRIHFWTGDSLSLFESLTLLRLGGHFEGGAVLHWPGGAEGRGTLLSGDIIQVVADRKHVSFMYSYPNYIPLSAKKINYIVNGLKGYSYDRIYGAFQDMEILENAAKAVRRSAKRYIGQINPT